MALDLSSAIVGDVVVRAYRSSVTNTFLMNFSARVTDAKKTELMAALQSQGINWGGPICPNTWHIPPTMDSLQAIEKICLWLESEGLEVCRKICECGSFKDIQSFVLA